MGLFEISGIYHDVFDAFIACLVVDYDGIFSDIVDI